MSDQSALDEPVLPDDYPVHAGYLYVLDGVPRSSDIRGTIADLKRLAGATEARRCDIVGRQRAAKVAGGKDWFVSAGDLSATHPLPGA